MKVNSDFILREIAGEHIIIPTGKTVLDFNGLITFNDVGVFLWKKLQNEISMDELVNAVLKEYDVPEKVAREDVKDFVDRLIKANILEKD